MTHQALMPDVDFGFDDLPDLYERIAELRKYGTVVPVTQWGQPSWAVLGYDEVARIFDDPVHFKPAAFYMKYAAPTMGRTIQSMDGPEHQQNRTVVTPPFLPAAIRRFTERSIEPMIHELLDRIVGQEEVEFVQAFARPFPFLVITRLLGIPVADEEKCLDWAIKLIDFPWDPDGAVRAKAEFDDYILKIVQARRDDPGDDLISLMVTADVDGRRLDDEEVMPFLRLLFPAGSDTTYKNGGSLFSCILAERRFREMAQQDDRARANLVTEGLRWQPPVALLPRIASEDVELGGASIKKDDLILVGIAAANNDPGRFPDPRRFDPSRNNSSMLTFGRGNHFCLGVHLARRELETALRVVFERFPNMQLAPDREIEFYGGLIRGPRELWVRPYG